MSIGSIFDLNILYAIAIFAGVVLFTRVIMPYLKRNNLELYDEVKLALLIMGHSFRDEKIKRITDIALDLAKDLEKIAIAPEDKLTVVVEEVSKKLIKDFKIDLEDEVLEVIVRVVVSILPPTNAVIE